MSEHTHLINPGVEGYIPDIGRMLWQLEDVRIRTLEWLKTISVEALDWQHDPFNGIGTLLYHIAAVELDWLFVEVLEREYSQEAIALFPFDVRDENGRLTVITGMSMEEHLNRFEKVRDMVRDVYREMTLEDFRRARVLEHYDVTPEWVLYHLMQHESEHLGEMMTVHTSAKGN